MTNHRDEAEAWLEYSGNENPEIDGRANHSASLAQVHATLYLAEQQRIANLIAVFSEGGLKCDLPSFTFDAWPNALGQIRTGLGLA